MAAKTGRSLEYRVVEQPDPIQAGATIEVPHDPEGLAQLLGGPDKASAELEDFFTKTPQAMGWNDYYNHSNEPVHHVPFLFNAWGHPWLTQKWTHEVIQRAYNRVHGICGIDDVGPDVQAWFVENRPL